MTRRELFKSLLVLAAAPLFALVENKEEVYFAKFYMLTFEESALKPVKFDFILENGQWLSFECENNIICMGSKNHKEKFKIKEFNIDYITNIELGGPYKLAGRLTDCIKNRVSFVRA